MFGALPIRIQMPALCRKRSHCSKACALPESTCLESVPEPSRSCCVLRSTAASMGCAPSCEKARPHKAVAWSSWPASKNSQAAWRKASALAGDLMSLSFSPSMSCGQLSRPWGVSTCTWPALTPSGRRARPTMPQSTTCWTPACKDFGLMLTMQMQKRLSTGTAVTAVSPKAVNSPVWPPSGHGPTATPDRSSDRGGEDREGKGSRASKDALPLSGSWPV
mmetsp:Transcript_79742/g.191327  ORF Transcript_79742/g.191327 Transcript_79742/m.191327 type:complete len:220 (+) Transcript_79742:1080-1739(+)